jgi:hypothetical protein
VSGNVALHIPHLGARLSSSWISLLYTRGNSRRHPLRCVQSQCRQLEEESLLTDHAGNPTTILQLSIPYLKTLCTRTESSVNLTPCLPHFLVPSLVIPVLRPFMCLFLLSVFISYFVPTLSCFLRSLSFRFEWIPPPPSLSFIGMIWFFDLGSGVSVLIRHSAYIC